MKIYPIALFMFTAIYLVPICLLCINVQALYIHQSVDMTRVRVPLYRELLEGITFQSVHHEKGRRELWWDSLYSYIGLYFMKSPKRAFEKARSRNCQVWKHMLPRLLISFTVAFFSWGTPQNVIHPSLYKVWCPSYLAACENVSTK